MLVEGAVGRMSLAAETRRAAAAQPFLVAALRAGVVNYTAAARFLEVDVETDAVATALRRYAEELPDHETESRDVRVRMQSGVGTVDGGDESEPLFSIGGVAFDADAGDSTAILATGAVDGAALADALRALALEGISPTAAGVGGDTLLVVVDRREGANALRTVETALERVRVSGDR